MIRTARRRGVPSLVVLCDLGSGAQKFTDEQGEAFPDFVAVADTVTYELLEPALGPERLRKVGSPYLDQFLSLAPRLGEQPGKFVGFASVPNTQDFLHWGKLDGYTEDAVLAIVSQGAGSSRTVRIRLHPKEFAEDRYRRPLPENALLESVANRPSFPDFVAESSHVLSTYSTSLIVAQLLGCPVASVQPAASPVRAALYRRCQIPILRTPGEVAQFLSRPAPRDGGVEIFNPRESLHSLCTLIDEILHVAA